MRGSVVLETRLGDLEVGIREGTAAWLDVRATAGKVHNALEAAEAPGPSAETVEVRGRTTAGNVGAEAVSRARSGTAGPTSASSRPRRRRVCAGDARPAGVALDGPVVSAVACCGR